MSTELLHQDNCKKEIMVTDFHTGEIACSSCGAVLSEKTTDSSQETIGFSSKDSQSNGRVGQKISLKMADMGLSTLIESKDKDVSGKSLSNENRRMFYRLRLS